MPHPATLSDPRPVPPLRPDNDDCCHGGCDPCIFDLYNQALERYQVQLQAWEARQAAAGNENRRQRPKR